VSRVERERLAESKRRTRVRIQAAEAIVCCGGEDEEEGLGVSSENSDDPSIIAHMKLLKMRPKGRSSSALEVVVLVEVCERADLSAALQKKMKRYIALSKKVDAMPSARMRLSCRIVWIPDLMSERELFELDGAP
jgi:hypothetical protein